MKLKNRNRVKKKSIPGATTSLDFHTFLLGPHTSCCPLPRQSRDLERSGSVGQKVKRSGGLRKSSMGIKNVQMKADEYEHNWLTRGDFQLHFFNPPLPDEPAGSLSRVCDTSSSAGLPATPLKCQGRQKPGGIARGEANIPPPVGRRTSRSPSASRAAMMFHQMWAHTRTLSTIL